MPIFGTKLHPPQLPVRKMPHFGTRLPGRPLLVQKDTLFGTKLHAPQLPVQKMPYLCTKLLAPHLLVQKDTLFGAGMPGKQLFGAGNQMICSRNFLLP